MINRLILATCLSLVACRTKQEKVTPPPVAVAEPVEATPNKEPAPLPAPVPVAVQAKPTPKPLTAFRIHYALDSADPEDFGLESLVIMAAQMKHRPGLKLYIDGHTDDRGSDQYNQTLGAYRATFAAEILIELGVDQRQLYPRSFGETRPAAKGKSEEARARNRRVDFIAKSGHVVLADGQLVDDDGMPL